jgi:hypothetical protein
MVKLVYMALPVALCVGGYLLIYGDFESPATLEQLEPHVAVAKVGGGTAGGWAIIPPHLIPA